MFELPDTRRIRRAELASPSLSHSSEHDSNLSSFSTQHQSSYRPSTYLGCGSSHILKAPTTTATTTDRGTGAAVIETEAEAEAAGAYPFRLFGAQAAKNVVIRSPSPPVGGGGFVRAYRGDGFYFSGWRRNAEERRRFDEVASGAEGLFEVARGWRGWEMPWRVITVKVKGTHSQSQQARKSREEEDQGVIEGTYEDSERKRKRRRKGKKMRIRIRMKVKKQKEAEEEGRRREEEKEERERGKRNRKNREKKVRRREKKREMKRVGGKDEA